MSSFCKGGRLASDWHQRETMRLYNNDFIHRKAAAVLKYAHKAIVGAHTRRQCGGGQTALLLSLSFAASAFWPRWREHLRGGIKGEAWADLNAPNNTAATQCVSLRASYPNPVERELDMAADLEHDHVQRVYSQIAAHFSDTRHKPWPRVAQFLTEQPAGSLVADVGTCSAIRVA